jgi:AcrR family transcriptional regulator
MARPRTHDLDDLLDVAEQLATSAGPGGLTLRRVADAAGAPTGTIYHAFSSKEALLARAWIRAAHRLQDRLERAVDAVAEASGTAGEAVVAASCSPVAFATDHPASARLFFMQRRDQLFSDGLAASVTAELEEIQQRFDALLTGLAQALWGRRDRTAVATIATCVVDLPGGLIQRQLLSGAVLDAQTSSRIAAACRAILALDLPPATTTSGSPRPSKETHP